MQKFDYKTLIYGTIGTNERIQARQGKRGTGFEQLKLYCTLILIKPNFLVSLCKVVIMHYSVIWHMKAGIKETERYYKSEKMNRLANNFTLSTTELYLTVMLWFVRLYEEILHELWWVVCLPYRWINRGMTFIPPL